MGTDAKANREFIKPKRRGIPYCKDNHICVYGFDYHFAKVLSYTSRNVEQNARICLIVGTWLDILDVTHVILCGDDRLIRCVGDYLSANFVSLFAVGQIETYFTFVSITPQGSLPHFAGLGAPAITRCICVVPQCVLRSIVDWFRRGSSFWLLKGMVVK